MINKYLNGTSLIGIFVFSIVLNSCNVIKEKSPNKDDYPDQNYKWHHPYLPFFSANECIDVDSLKTKFDAETGKIIIEFELKDKDGVCYFGGSGNDNKKIWCYVSDSVNGEVYKIDDFTVTEKISKKTDNNAVYLILDHSGSMGERAYFVQDAVIELIKNKRLRDAFSVIKFDTKIFKEVSLTSEKGLLLQKFSRSGLTGFGGNTSLFEAMDFAVKDMESLNNFDNKLLIVFTDGQDNTDKQSKDKTLVEDALKNNVKIYSIDFSKKTDSNKMKVITKETKGKQYKIFQTVEIQNVFEDIYNDLTLSSLKYNISYTPKTYFGSHTTKFMICQEECIINKICPSIENIMPDSVQLHIYFEFDKAEIIDPNSLDQIDMVANYLSKNPKIKIKLNGHTDCRGTDKHNEILSQARADTVAAILTRKGISKTRIFTAGLGAKFPYIVTQAEHDKYHFLTTGVLLTCDYISKLSNEAEKEYAHSLNRRTWMIIIK